MLQLLVSKRISVNMCVFTARPHIMNTIRISARIPNQHLLIPNQLHTWNDHDSSSKFVHVFTIKYLR